MGGGRRAGRQRAWRGGGGRCAKILDRGRARTIVRRKVAGVGGERGLGVAEALVLHLLRRLLRSRGGRHLRPLLAQPRQPPQRLRARAPRQEIVGLIVLVRFVQLVGALEDLVAPVARRRRARRLRLGRRRRRTVALHRRRERHPTVRLSDASAHAASAVVCRWRAPRRRLAVLVLVVRRRVLLRRLVPGRRLRVARRHRAVVRRLARHRLRRAPGVAPSPAAAAHGGSRPSGRGDLLRQLGIGGGLRGLLESSPSEASRLRTRRSK